MIHQKVRGGMDMLSVIDWDNSLPGTTRKPTKKIIWNNEAAIHFLPSHIPTLENLAYSQPWKKESYTIS